MSEPSPRIVVDSSVAVKWFMSAGEDHVDDAFELLDRHRDGAITLAAPSHVVLEVVNALWSKGVGATEMTSAVGRMLGAYLQLIPCEDLAASAATISSEHGLTVYDAAFVALAESLDAELVTADRRLAACPACRTRLLGS